MTKEELFPFGTKTDDESLCIVEIKILLNVLLLTVRLLKI